MLGRADADMNGIAVDLDDGEVLFDRAVGGAGVQFPHGLAAADGGDGGLLYHLDDLSADFALVEFHQ